MGEIDPDYECHKQSTSTETKSCVNRASFIFMANFENFFFRLVVNLYLYFPGFSIFLALNNAAVVHLETTIRTWFTNFYYFKASVYVVC